MGKSFLFFAPLKYLLLALAEKQWKESKRPERENSSIFGVLCCGTTASRSEEEAVAAPLARPLSFSLFLLLRLYFFPFSQWKFFFYFIPAGFERNIQLESRMEEKGEMCAKEFIVSIFSRKINLIFFAGKIEFVTKESLSLPLFVPVSLVSLAFLFSFFCCFSLALLFHSLLYSLSISLFSVFQFFSLTIFSLLNSSVENNSPDEFFWHLFGRTLKRGLGWERKRFGWGWLADKHPRCPTTSIRALLHNLLLIL